MILPELSAYLVANASGFVAGPSTGSTQVWLGRFPEDAANTSVALFESGGVGPNYTYSGLSFERPSVQVISRSTSYVTARNNAQTVYDLLAAIENTTLTGTPYLSISPIQSPFDIGNDAGGRAMVSCNYQTDKAVSA